MKVGGVNVRLPHICKTCEVALNEDGSNFPTRWVGDQQYYRFLCRKCFNAYTHERKDSPYGPSQKRYAKKCSEQRRAGLETEKWILRDTRGWDRKHGFVPDLDLVFVKDIIALGCSYCDAKSIEIRVGLDRIDNTEGHLKSNVVSCCTRCNLVRGDMPYQAWLIVAAGMKVARKLGLFENWIPGNKRKV